MIHKVYDVCKSEIVTKLEESDAIVTIGDLGDKFFPLAWDFLFNIFPSEGGLLIALHNNFRGWFFVYR